jgi:PAS domain S-box-containing protein
MTTVLSTSGLGIHNISNFAFPVILIAASLVASKRALFVLTILSVLCLAWLVFGELWGFYEPDILTQSIPGDFLAASLIVILTAVILQQLTDPIFQSFSQVQKEVVERRAVEDGLRQREALLQAVTFAAEQFLKPSDWRHNIDSVLGQLGRTFRVSHAYLFEHHIGTDGIEYSELKYEWSAEDHASDFENAQYQKPKPINLNFGSTDFDLRNGRMFVGNASTFPPTERGRLVNMGVKAMVEVPLFVDGKWWGTFGLDDMEIERNWGPAELDALKIAAGILEAAIKRDLAESAVRESERIYRQAIEASGMIPYYRSYTENRYTFVGTGIEQMIGYTPEEITPQLFQEIMKENVPLGEGSGIEINDAVFRSRSGRLKVWRSDMRLIARNGEVKWLNDSAVELFDGSTELSYASVGILHDVTDRKLTEFNLRKRESLLNAVAFSAERFLRTSDWREEINGVLERLGREFGATHAYLFENHPGPNGEKVHSMRFEWTSPGQTPDMDNPSFQGMTENDVIFERYHEILRRGDPFVGTHTSFNDIEREHFGGIGIKAILELQVMVGGEQWGTIGFDDRMDDREWTEMEVDVIKAAANVLGAAIKRQLDEGALKNELAERRRTEAALRFSEEKFSKAFHTTQMLMTIEDENRMFVDVNEAFLEALGLAREEVIGHSPSELNLFYDEEDESILRRASEANDEIVKDVEVRIRRKYGEPGHILLSSERIYLDNSEYVLTSGLDITERKKAEERYRSIFNNSMDGIFQSTDDGHFLNVNPAMAHIYGYDSPEDMLKSVNDIRSQVYVNPEDRNEVRRRLSSGERLTGYETLDYRKDGTSFWASMSAQAIRDNEDNILYYEGTVEDVTPRKQAEAEREALIDELAAKNSELERFTYTVSHDLKSPLVTINGFLGYLEQDAILGNKDRLKMDIQRINEAVLKMQRLLNELLELSRIGRIINPPETVPFSELAEEAKGIVHGQLEERGVVVSIQSDLPAVYGDRPRLIEIIQNLFDNAAKYMGDQPRPLIEVGQQGNNNDLPVFYVRDNGIGIEAQHHERIFGLFNKLDPKSEGTGIGLALVKRIIEVHGGRIWVESEAGKGSTFLFTLPTGPQA